MVQQPYILQIYHLESILFGLNLMTPTLQRLLTFFTQGTSSQTTILCLFYACFQLKCKNCGFSAAVNVLQFKNNKLCKNITHGCLAITNSIRFASQFHAPPHPRLKHANYDYEKHYLCCQQYYPNSNYF